MIKIEIFGLDAIIGDFQLSNYGLILASFEGSNSSDEEVGMNHNTIEEYIGYNPTPIYLGSSFESTTPVQALKYCERLLRRLSQHLTFSLASLPQKRGMEFPHRCLYLSNNVICPSTPSLRNSFLYSFP